MSGALRRRQTTDDATLDDVLRRSRMRDNIEAVCRKPA
jgi:hypothetical protein